VHRRAWDAGPAGQVAVQDGDQHTRISTGGRAGPHRGRDPPELLVGGTVAAVGASIATTARPPAA
jgi:hypothetical protein